MAKPSAFPQIRAEVIRRVQRIPEGRFTTYGSIARYLGCNPRLVARALGGLDEKEAAETPWHRVVAAEGRISPSMDPALAGRQRELLEREGLRVSPRGFIENPDASFHAVGIGRDPGAG